MKQALASELGQAKLFFCKKNLFGGTQGSFSIIGFILQLIKNKLTEVESGKAKYNTILKTFKAKIYYFFTFTSYLYECGSKIILLLHKIEL